MEWRLAAGKQVKGCHHRQATGDGGGGEGAVEGKRREKGMTDTVGTG